MIYIFLFLIIVDAWLNESTDLNYEDYISRDRPLIDRKKAVTDETIAEYFYSDSCCATVRCDASAATSTWPVSIGRFNICRFESFGSVHAYVYVRARVHLYIHTCVRACVSRHATSHAVFPLARSTRMRIYVCHCKRHSWQSIPIPPLEARQRSILPFRGKPERAEKATARWEQPVPGVKRWIIVPEDRLESGEGGSCLFPSRRSEKQTVDDANRALWSFPTAMYVARQLIPIARSYKRILEVALHSEAA